MRIQLTESKLRKIIKEAIDEMAYPSHFNMLEFKSIKSYKGKVQYCEQHLQRIASGSSRITYKIDNEKVLKLAKNRKGLAQNEAEYNSWAIKCNIGANVFDADEEEYYWIEMELARKATAADFKNILGLTFKQVQDAVALIHNNYCRPDKRVYCSNTISDEEIWDENKPWSEWMYNLSSYMGDTTLGAIGDLQRISSWGVVKRNGEDDLVLIDFGLNNDVAERYYNFR